MNILFVNANLYGHINPTLGLVKKLTDKGNNVSYFCSEEFSNQVSEMGGKWIGFSHKLQIFLKEYRPTDRHPFFMLLEYMLLYDEAMLPEILNIIGKKNYDMIICDSIFGGACFLKQLINIPVVCSHSSFAMSQEPVPKRMLVAGFHPQLDNCYKVLKRICEKYKIVEPSLRQVFTSKGDLNIVYTTYNFNGDSEIHEPDYLFAGPSIARQQETHVLDFPVIEKKKIIYISLGSLNTNFLDFYKMCISAFRNFDYHIYMSIGKNYKVSQLGEIPSNFTVMNFLPQLDILNRAELFITHAGFNSVNEALYFGVPMLALPQVNDQNKVAKRLVDMQLGIMENINDLSIESLLAKAQALMADENIKANCMQISQEMKNTANSQHVVDKLIKFPDEWKGANE